MIKFNKKSTSSFKSNVLILSEFNIVIKDWIAFESSIKLNILIVIAMIDAIVFYKLNFRKNKTAKTKNYFIIIFEIDNV